MQKAIEDGDLVAVERFLQNTDIDMNYRRSEDYLGGTALLLAIYNNDTSLVDLLLAAKADTSLTGDYGKPPIAEAVIMTPKILQLLLDRGADVVRAADVAAAKTLIDHGATLANSRDETVFDFCFNKRVTCAIELYLAT
jgi:ankyrin repeat protein